MVSVLNFLILIIVLWLSKTCPYFGEINTAIFEEEMGMMQATYSQMASKGCVCETENVK